MLAELIEFVDSILPSVSLAHKDSARKAILQFEKQGEQIKYMTLYPIEELSQGDILSPIPFSFFDKTGEQNIFNAEAMVLSTSCNIDNKEKIVLVPVLPLDEFNGNVKELQNNTIYDFMYIPDPYMAEKYIDFECMNSYSKELISSGISSKRIQRLGSLNQMGYYLFIIKLTIYLMRKEDDGTFLKRENGMIM